jgi:hypothetical protein
VVAESGESVSAQRHEQVLLAEKANLMAIEEQLNRQSIEPPLKRSASGKRYVHPL